MAYMFPLLSLTETDSFTKFCTKYFSDFNRTREGTRSGSVVRRNGVGAHTQTRQNSIAQFWTCTVCFRRIQINIIKEVQLKNRIQTCGKRYGPRSVHTIIHNITHRTLLPCGELYYTKKCYAVDAVLPVGSVFNWTPCTVSPSRKR